MSVIDIRKTKGSFTDYLDRASGAPIIITLEGKPYAELVMLGGNTAQDDIDFEAEVAAHSRSPQLRAILKHSHEDYQANGGVAFEDIDWGELGVESAPMRTIEVSQATGSLLDYVPSVGDVPVMFTVDGEPYAALVRLADLKALPEEQEFEADSTST